MEDEQDNIPLMTPEQIGVFLVKTKEQKHKALFNVAIFSGARQKELLDLSLVYR